MSTYLSATLMSLLAGWAIHLFFRVIRRATLAGVHGQLPAHPGYLSVSDYVTTKRRRRLYYLFFRHLPPLIVTMLLCGLLNKLYPELWTLPFLLLATFSSVALGSLRASFKKGLFFSERIIHLYNVAVVNLTALATQLASHSTWLAAVTPSLEGIVDNIWSSLFVSLIVVAFIESSQRGPMDVQRERELVAEHFVESSLNKIEQRFGQQIDELCGPDRLLSRLLRAILVFEDMNRPFWVRAIERWVVRLTGMELTVGIAQVRSQRPLSDVESITEAHGLLTRGPDQTASEQAPERLLNLIRRYNDDARYCENVSFVYSRLPTF